MINLFVCFLAFCCCVIQLTTSQVVSPDGVYLRAAHRKHVKLPYSCRDPEFCTHPMDDNDELNKNKWPALIEKYVHCMDLVCQCPAFNGTIRKGKCIRPDGKVLKKAVRKEYRHLTDAERRKYVATMNAMHNAGLINQIGVLHQLAGVHSGPAFFPWHREFFKRFELLLRVHEPDLALPYWDSTLDNWLPQPENSTLFTRDLMGEPGDSGYVYDTVYTNWTTMDNRPTWYRGFGTQPDGELINNKRIEWLLQQDDIHYVLSYSMPLIGCANYTLDERFLEYSHDYVHYFVSGDMQDRITSSNDPIFYAHHSFVDSLWEMWRRKWQSSEEREHQWPRDSLECAPAWHFANASMPLLAPFTNSDALSNKYTDLLYTFAPRPTCLGHSDECRSRHLFCDPHTTPSEPHCVARIKLHGNCSGFEWSDDACFKGRCQKGICREESNSEEISESGSTLSDSKIESGMKNDKTTSFGKHKAVDTEQLFPIPPRLEGEIEKILEETRTISHKLAEVIKEVEPFRAKTRVHRTSRFM